MTLYAVPSFDIHPGSRRGPLLIFVHGGAWKSEDKADHAYLARSLATATGCPVAVPNYRLTPVDNTDPRLRHPMHAQDLLAFLTAIRSAPPPDIDADNLLLIGHSCSAHMIAAILLDACDPALVPDHALLAAIKAVVCSEGIYDLDALLARFPAYRAWFVAPAFGDRADYADVNATRFPVRAGAPQLEWLLLHSKGDTLVHRGQSERMYAHLARLAPACKVSLDMDALAEEHDEVLKGQAYVKQVAAFATRVFALDLRDV